MRQTERTAIVLRAVNYRENDRMLTLLSPTQGKIEALCRGCRKQRSPLLNASELFALGDYELYRAGDKYTVTSAMLTETFYPLRSDYERLTAGIWLLNLTEEASQPGKPAADLFLLLLHTLSRLTFTDQAWRPLLAGFLLNYANGEGFKPRLNHCVTCGRSVMDEPLLRFDLEAGGLVCPACARTGQPVLRAEQAQWMRTMLTKPASAWIDSPEAPAPYALLRRFTEMQLGHPMRSGEALPKT